MHLTVHSNIGFSAEGNHHAMHTIKLQGW